MSYSLDYCCEQIEKVQTEVLVDQLRRLAAESEGRFGSRGNTARLLRVIAARLERDQAGVVVELRKLGGSLEYQLAADLVAEKLAGKK